MPHDATVFVVDDDPAVRKSLHWLFESVGVSMQSFPSAQAFIDAYDPAQPGCLILDIRMPGMSGLELQQKLKAAAMELPVIIVTGHGDVSTAVRAMKQGAVDLLEKPYSDQAMLDLVQKCLKQSEEQRRQATRRKDAIERLERLTKRERDVHDLVLRGKTNKEIAQTLGISPKTVEVHRSRLMEKMGTQSLAALVEISLLAKENSDG